MSGLLIGDELAWIGESTTIGEVLRGFGEVLLEIGDCASMVGNSTGSAAQLASEDSASIFQSSSVFFGSPNVSDLLGPTGSRTIPRLVPLCPRTGRTRPRPRLPRISIGLGINARRGPAGLRPRWKISEADIAAVLTWVVRRDACINWPLPFESAALHLSHSQRTSRWLEIVLALTWLHPGSMGGESSPEVLTACSFEPHSFPRTAL